MKEIRSKADFLLERSYRKHLNRRIRKAIVDYERNGWKLTTRGMHLGVSPWSPEANLDSPESQENRVPLRTISIIDYASGLHFLDFETFQTSRGKIQML